MRPEDIAEYLRALDYKIIVRHYRCGVHPDKPQDTLTGPMDYNSIRAQGYVPGPLGGETVATLYDKLGNVVAVGLAKCRTPKYQDSPGDAFNKAIGRSISLGRLFCTRSDHNPQLKTFPDIMHIIEKGRG